MDILDIKWATYLATDLVAALNLREAAVLYTLLDGQVQSTLERIWRSGFRVFIIY